MQAHSTVCRRGHLSSPFVGVRACELEWPFALCVRPAGPCVPCRYNKQVLKEFPFPLTCTMIQVSKALKK